MLVEKLIPQAEPDLSAESTPTGGWCQMKQANIFTEIIEISTNFFSFEPKAS